MGEHDPKMLIQAFGKLNPSTLDAIDMLTIARVLRLAIQERGYQYPFIYQLIIVSHPTSSNSLGSSITTSRRYNSASRTGSPSYENSMKYSSRTLII
jgi:hypothetical protein